MFRHSPDISHPAAHREDSHSFLEQSRDMCLITVALRQELLELGPIYHASHHFANTQTTVICYCTIKTQHDFLYKSLSGMSIPKYYKGRFAS